MSLTYLWGIVLWYEYLVHFRDIVMLYIIASHNVVDFIVHPHIHTLTHSLTPPPTHTTQTHTHNTNTHTHTQHKHNKTHTHKHTNTHTTHTHTHTHTPAAHPGSVPKEVELRKSGGHSPSSANKLNTYIGDLGKGGTVGKWWVWSCALSA